jgi:hypothetical protein
MSAISSQEMGERRTSFGSVLYVKFSRHDGKRIGWSALWRAFSSRYPGQWAVQFFPPVEDLIDEANYYHLFVLEDPPHGVNINPRTRTC